MTSLVAQMVKQRPGFNSCVGKILWRRKWQPTLVFWPGESPGERRLIGQSPRGLKESDTEGHHFHHIYDTSVTNVNFLEIFLFEDTILQLNYSLKMNMIKELSAALNMPANLEKSAVAPGLEKVSFHSNPKERQYQRMLELLHNCTNFTRQ